MTNFPALSYVTRLVKCLLFLYLKPEKGASSGRSLLVYTACFEKGCPTKSYATMWEDMGNGGSWVLDCGFRCFTDIEGNSTNKCSYAFSFLVAKHREPQSSDAKLFLPIIPIDVVAYAFTLLGDRGDNVCRNSCI